MPWRNSTTTNEFRASRRLNAGDSSPMPRPARPHGGPGLPDPGTLGNVRQNPRPKGPAVTRAILLTVLAVGLTLDLPPAPYLAEPLIERSTA